MVNLRQQVEESAQAVSGYLAGDGDRQDLMATMGRMMLREDAGFHSFQIVDAAFRQFESRQASESGRHVMIGLSRFLAAHSPDPQGRRPDLPDSPEAATRGRDLPVRNGRPSPFTSIDCPG